MKTKKLRQLRVCQLPPDTRMQLAQRLLDSGFTDYQGHVDWLKSSSGIFIPVSTLHRYGQRLRDLLRTDRDLNKAVLSLQIR